MAAETREQAAERRIGHADQRSMMTSSRMFDGPYKLMQHNHYCSRGKLTSEVQIPKNVEAVMVKTRTTMMRPGKNWVMTMMMMKKTSPMVRPPSGESQLMGAAWNRRRRHHEQPQHRRFSKQPVQRQSRPWSFR